MVGLINMNYQTRFCKFSIDSDSDLSSLPKLESPGKESLSTIKSCAHGSLVYATNGKTYVLSGENEWILYSGYSPGGNTETEDIEPISKSYIESLFKNKGDDKI